ncbi:MAG: hypothetical protein JWN95_1465 [Frankiales bacterium]|nr:hypothetical protein [Frankiales bacterium]
MNESTIYAATLEDINRVLDGEVELLDVAADGEETGIGFQPMTDWRPGGYC